MASSENTAYLVPSVLYLGMPYEGAAFDDFPELHGYNRLVILDGYLKDYESARISAFVQAWLCLGLLIEVLNEALGLNHQKSAMLKTKDFVAMRDDGREIFDTTSLTSHLTAWYERAQTLDLVAKGRSRDRIAHVVRTARSFASKTLTVDASQAEGFPFQPEIQSSLVVLGSLLDQHASIVYGTGTGTWPQSLTALQRLSRSCPNDLAWLTSEFTTDVIYLRSNLWWPKGNRDHSRCDQRVCVADKIDLHKYSTLHTADGCDCVWVNISEDDLLAELENDNVPLLVPPSLDGDASDWKIISSSASPDISYVAISHVWSGGLGNPTKNSLPSCQLEKIRKCVTELGLDNDPPFWIDTLCVPQRRHGKKLAVSKMKRTYQDAARVMVLDTQLMQTSIEFQRWQLPATDHKRIGFAKEFLLRIATSSWMRRLWTFQEGAIARELVFVFGNGSLDLRQLLLAMKGDRTPFANQVLSRLMILRGLLYPLNRSLQLTHLLGALKWRSTSHAEDEAICIATLLELPNENFLDLPLDEHMPRLLTAIESIPASLLFSHGPRLDVQNFSWAPRSFLNSYDMLDLGGSTQDGDGFGLCTSSGFTARLPGWITSHPVETPSSGKFWWIQEETTTTTTTLPNGGRLMQVVRSAQSTKRLTDWHRSDDDDDDDDDTTSVGFGSEKRKKTRMGFVIKVPTQVLLPTGTTESFKGLCVAITAAKKSEEGSVFSVRPVCLVIVMTCDYSDLLTDVDIQPTAVERVSGDQMWCFT